MEYFVLFAFAKKGNYFVLIENKTLSRGHVEFEKIKRILNVSVMCAVFDNRFEIAYFVGFCKHHPKQSHRDQGFSTVRFNSGNK